MPLLPPINFYTRSSATSYTVVHRRRQSAHRRCMEEGWKKAQSTLRTKLHPPSDRILTGIAGVAGALPVAAHRRGAAASECEMHQVRPSFEPCSPSWRRCSVMSAVHGLESNLIETSASLCGWTAKIGAISGTPGHLDSPRSVMDLQHRHYVA